MHMTMDKPALSWWQKITKDGVASLVVFLISVPMAMGIALASNAPVSAGLVSALIGGVVVGALAGAPLQVSGPSAALAIVVYGLVQEHGFPAVCVLVMAAGALQILLGVFKLARLTLMLSPAVVHGMVAGSGILLVISQIHTLLGGGPKGSLWGNLSLLPAQLANLHWSAFWIGLLTIAVIVVWQFLPWKWARLIPAALVGVVVGTLVSLGQTLPRISLPVDASHSVSWPMWPHMTIADSIQAVVTLAFLASAESLVCAVAIDKLHGERRANLDKELWAQGVGNLLCGILGGLPLSGAIARSKANVEAGGRTRFATIASAIWLFLCLLFFHTTLQRIPTCVLAGMLTVIGFKLIRLEPIRTLKKHKELSIYVITVLGVLGINLLGGILLGIGVSLIRLIKRLTRVHIQLEQYDQTWHVTIKGPLTFVSLPKMNALLTQIPGAGVVRFHLQVESIDHATLEALHDFQKRYEMNGGSVEMDLSSFYPAPKTS